MGGACAIGETHFYAVENNFERYYDRKWDVLLCIL
jgi:hypothetical protein